MTETTLHASDFDARTAARIFREHLAGIHIAPTDITDPRNEGSHGWHVNGLVGWQARESGTLDEHGTRIPLLRVWSPSDVLYNCGLTPVMVERELREDAERGFQPFAPVRAAWPQPDHSVVLSVEYPG